MLGPENFYQSLKIKIQSSNDHMMAQPLVNFERCFRVYMCLNKRTVLFM